MTHFTFLSLFLPSHSCLLSYISLSFSASFSLFLSLPSPSDVTSRPLPQCHAAGHAHVSAPRAPIGAVLASRQPIGAVLASWRPIGAAASPVVAAPVPA